VERYNEFEEWRNTILSKYNIEPARGTFVFYDEEMDSPAPRRRFAPLAAALSALATLACCLPLGIAGAVGALGLSVALEALRPWLIALSVLLLAVGVIQLYRDGKACRRRSRLGILLFGISAAVVLLVMIFPQTVAGLMTFSLPKTGAAQLSPLSSLQDDFNRAPASLRIILLLSPT
jgi:uncharacterized membrane protein YidH (DUF202 family)